MGAKQSQSMITLIDVGSAKTCVLIGEAVDGALRYRGHGIVESKGTRKGAIADLDKAAGAIQRAAEEAERVAGVSIDTATVTVGGPLIKGVNSRGGVSLGHRSREIARSEEHTSELQSPCNLVCRLLLA